MTEHWLRQKLIDKGVLAANTPPATSGAVALKLPAAPAGDAKAARYAHTALANEVRAVAETPKGGRNHRLNKAAFNIGQLVAAGHLDGQHAADALAGAARQAGLKPRETALTVKSGLKAGADHPRDVQLNDPAASTTFTPPAHTLNGHTNGHRPRPSNPLPDGKTPEPASAAESSRPDDAEPSQVEDDRWAALLASVGDVPALYPQLDWPTVFAATPEQVEWLVEPLLERGRLYCLYSPAKAGKSLLTLDLVAALATGTSALGRPAQSPLDVLYVDLENAEADVVERLRAFGHGPEALERLHYLSFPTLPALDSPAGGRHLLAATYHYRASVVVIDTVSRTVAGGENDSDTFHALYRYAMAPLKAAGITVLRLDHAGKDAERGMRGSSAKISDVDVAWKLSRISDQRLRLDRIASRNSHSPEHLDVDVFAEPLRHQIISAADTATTELGRLVGTLARLGIPTEWGRVRVRKTLVENGIRVSDALLTDAIRARRFDPWED